MTDWLGSTLFGFLSGSFFAAYACHTSTPAISPTAALVFGTLTAVASVAFWFIGGAP